MLWGKVNNDYRVCWKHAFERTVPMESGIFILIKNKKV